MNAIDTIEATGDSIREVGVLFERGKLFTTMSSAPPAACPRS